MTSSSLISSSWQSLFKTLGVHLQNGAKESWNYLKEDPKRAIMIIGACVVLTVAHTILSGPLATLGARFTALVVLSPVITFGVRHLHLARKGPQWIKDLSQDHVRACNIAAISLSIIATAFLKAGYVAPVSCIWSLIAFYAIDHHENKACSKTILAMYQSAKSYVSQKFASSHQRLQG